MSQPTVLILDDDCAFARAAGHLAMQEGFQVQLAHTVREARSFVRRHRCDLLILDLHLPDGSGLDVLNGVDLAQHGQIAIVTGKPSIETAITAIGLPVVDYLRKPFRPEQLQALLQRTMQRAWLEPVDEARVTARLLGNSPAMRDVVETVQRVAASGLPVLLTGESGTGKELAASAIHEASGRTGPFVVYDCSGSAVGDGQSAFERAAGGTLLLANVCELPLPLQAHLLRMVEKNDAAAAAATGDGAPPPRVLFSSISDPQTCVANGTFREDLYYAISALTLPMPPLRERGDDAVLLAQRFIARLNAHYGRKKRLAPGADAAILRHPWPGNVRELRGAVQRAYLLQRSDMLHVNPATRALAHDEEVAAAIAFPIGTPLAEIERRAVLTTLAHFKQDKAAAARALGISVRTIYNHLARDAEGRSEAGSA